MSTPLSKMAEQLKGSEIIKLAGEINSKIQQGATIYNFTIGDFDASLFPIPAKLKQYIIEAYEQNLTNYPPANGMLSLREAIRQFILMRQGLDYPVSGFLVSGGARPLIYAVYQTLLDPGEKVLFPVPSWNNNHYTHLSRGQAIAVQTLSQNRFLPTANELRPYIQEAALLTLCSPLNPTGTVFSESQLSDICNLVLDENERRKATGQKPLYLMYDQIYWTLIYGENKHFDPVSLFPALRPYTLYIDGLSKAFAATGVRVGWAFGPEEIIAKMSNILGHVGAWAPKAEQHATACYLRELATVDTDINHLKKRLEKRLNAFYRHFIRLSEMDFPVDAIAPQAALYLTVKIDLLGKTTPYGQKLERMEDITMYLLNSMGLALVPFMSFGASTSSPWYRLSVGTSKTEEIDHIMNQFEQVLAVLQ